MLRRIFGSKVEEVTGGCRKLRTEELQNLYSSPNIIRIIASRKMTDRNVWNAWGGQKYMNNCSREN
jgi:hypothetical protein